MSLYKLFYILPVKIEILYYKFKLVVMILDEYELRKRVNELLFNQRLAVLSSNMKDQPYPSLIAFAHTNDLQNLFFTTLRNSNKYKNIKNNPKISILIDNRGNSPSDISDAIAVSVFGTASEIDINDKHYSECKAFFYNKFGFIQESIKNKFERRDKL